MNPKTNKRVKIAKNGKLHIRTTITTETGFAVAIIAKPKKFLHWIPIAHNPRTGVMTSRFQKQAQKAKRLYAVDMEHVTPFIQEARLWGSQKHVENRVAPQMGHDAIRNLEHASHIQIGAKLSKLPLPPTTPFVRASLLAKHEADRTGIPHPIRAK